MGYDSGKNERKRAERGQDKWPRGHSNRYPLMEWGWDREACIEAIRAEGLQVPVKSACFMCPNCKKHEIVDLAATHPELMDKARLLEAKAVEKGLQTTVGLGRRFAWTDFIDGLAA